MRKLMHQANSIVHYPDTHHKTRLGVKGTSFSVRIGKAAYFICDIVGYVV